MSKKQKDTRSIYKIFMDALDTLNIPSIQRFTPDAQVLNKVLSEVAKDVSEFKDISVLFYNPEVHSDLHAIHIYKKDEFVHSISYSQHTATIWFCIDKFINLIAPDLKKIKHEIRIDKKSSANLLPLFKDKQVQVSEPKRKYKVTGSSVKPNVKSFTEVDAKDVIVLLKDKAFKKIFAAVDFYAKEHMEIGFYGWADKISDNEYHITDVEIPKQTIQSAHFDVDSQAIYAMPDPKRLRVLVHSHHSMGTFFSGNDEETMKQGAAECGKDGFYISVIVNSARNTVAKLYDKSRDRIERVTVAYEADEEVNTWLEARDKEVERYKYVYQGTARSYSGWGYDCDDYGSSYHTYDTFGKPRNYCSVCSSSHEDLIPYNKFTGSTSHICPECLSNIYINPELIFTNHEDYRKDFPDNEFVDDDFPELRVHVIEFFNQNPIIAGLVSGCWTHESKSDKCDCKICQEHTTSISASGYSLNGRLNTTLHPSDHFCLNEAILKAIELGRPIIKLNYDSSFAQFIQATEEMYEQEQSEDVPLTPLTEDVPIIDNISEALDVAEKMFEQTKDKEPI